MSKTSLKKILVWFHSFPEEPEVMIEDQLFNKIELTVFNGSYDKAGDNQLFSGHFSNFLAFLTNQNDFDEVKVILPAREVLYTTVAVPSKSRNRIIQALPFLLEDSLVNAVDKQYFALGDTVSGKCNVAIVREFIIKILFEQFKKLSLPVSIMTSEVFMLPWHENQWSIGFFDDQFVVRMEHQYGLTNHIHNIEFILELLLKKSLQVNNNSTARSEENSLASESEQKSLATGTESSATSTKSTEESSSSTTDVSNILFPEKIVFYTSEEGDKLNKIRSISNEYPIEIEIVKSNMLECMLTNDSMDKKSESNWFGINLLQRKYLSGNLIAVKVPFLIPIISLFVLALISQFAFMGIQWKTYTDLHQQSQTRLEQLYFKTFPNSKRLIDVRTQAENNLKQLQNKSSSGNSFLSLLGLVGNEIRLKRDIKIISLQYNDAVLQLNLESNGFVFNKLKSALESKHQIKVEEKLSSRNKGKVLSILTFRANNI